MSDGLFLVVNTGADHAMADINATAFSVLVRFDESTKTFTTGRTISRLPGGHFVYTALHASGSDVYMFGTGKYRGSDIYDLRRWTTERGAAYAPSLIERFTRVTGNTLRIYWLVSTWVLGIHVRQCLRART